MKNTHYILMPSDAIQEYHSKKNRKKASAFMEYFYDMHHEEINSVRFYAKSWDVSKSAAGVWIKEFKEKIDSFFRTWQLKNNQHYTSVQKSCGQQVDKTPLQNTDNIDTFKIASGQQSDKDYNIYSSGNKEFLQQINELRLKAGKYLGDIEEIYKTYTSMKHKIDIKVLSHTYKSYLETVSLKDKILGLKKFIDQSLYLHYLPKKFYIKDISGFWDTQKEVFITQEQTYKLTAASLLEKLDNNEVRFIL